MKKIEKVILFVLLITLLINPLFILTITKDNFVLPKEIFINLLIALAFLLWVIKGIFTKKVIYLKTPLILFFIGFFITQIISLYGCPNLYEANRKLLLYLSYLLIFLLGSSIDQEKKIVILLNTILFGGVIVSLIGISQYLEIKILPAQFYLQEEWKYKAFSTFGNPQFLASYLILTLPLSLSLFISGKQKIWYALSSLFIGFGLLVTNTRGAWISVFFALLLLIILFYKYKYQSLAPHSVSPSKSLSKILLKNRLIFSFIFLIIFSLSFSFYYTKAYKKVPSLIKQFQLLLPKNNASVAGRIFTWKIALKIIKQHPLTGIGLGNFKVFYPSFKADYLKKVDYSAYAPSFFARKEYVHNEFLQIWLESGIFSLLFFLLFLGGVFIFIYSSLKRLKKSKQPLQIGILSSLVSVLFFSFLFFPWQIPSSGSLFFFLIGISLSYSHLNTETPKQMIYPLTLSKGGGIILAEIIVIFGVFILISNTKNFLSDYFLKQGELLLKENRPKKAIISFEKGLKKNRDKGELNYALGFAWLKLKDYQKAQNYFQKTLSLLPEKGIFYSLGNIYQKKKLYSQAILEYKKALSIDPTFADAHFNLGIILVKQQAYVKAIAALQKAKYYAQNNAVKIYSLNNLANCYFIKKDKKQAFLHWKKMLSLLRTNPEVVIPNLDKIKTLIGQKD
ncbi:O-antigen ligase family protein [Candidatus Auribacterota bacterium]